MRKGTVRNAGKKFVVTSEDTKRSLALLGLEVPEDMTIDQRSNVDSKYRETLLDNGIRKEAQ